MNDPTMRTTPLAAGLLVAASLLLAGSAAAQYRWVEKDGSVHYGDAPPRDARDVRPINLRANPQPPDDGSISNLPFELRRAVERHPIVLYTAPDCAPCELARNFLRARGVPHAEKTITSAAEVNEFARRTGSQRLPYMSVGTQAQSSFDPPGWHAALDAAGYPRGSMLPRSYQWPAGQALVPPEQAPATAPTTEQAAAPSPAATPKQ